MVKIISQLCPKVLAWLQLCPHAMLLTLIPRIIDSQVSRLVQPSFGVSSSSPAAHALVRN